MLTQSMSKSSILIYKFFNHHSGYQFISLFLFITQTKIFINLQILPRFTAGFWSYQVLTLFIPNLVLLLCPILLDNPKPSTSTVFTCWAGPVAKESLSMKTLRKGFCWKPPGMNSADLVKLHFPIRGRPFQHKLKG
jgi:hypothetical protein